jgi:hypothetical protein
MFGALTSRKVRSRGLIEAAPGAAIAGNLSGDDHPRVYCRGLIEAKWTSDPLRLIETIGAFSRKSKD